MRLRRRTISCALHKDLDLQIFSASSRDGERIFVEEWDSRTNIFRHTSLTCPIQTIFTAQLKGHKLGILRKFLKKRCLVLAMFQSASQ
jgi:hypothetical protein